MIGAVILGNQTTLRGHIASRLPDFAFIGRALPRILGWPALCLLLVGLTWVLTLSRLADERRTLEKNAFKDAASLSHSYAQQLSHTVEQLDQITLNVSYYWKESGGTLSLEKQAEHNLYPAAADLSISIVDRKGIVVTGLRKNARSIDVSDRPYFQAHKRGQENGLRISILEQGRVLEKSIIGFSRTLTAADGSFDGLLFIACAPGILASFYDKSAHGKDDILAVAMKDGTPIVTEMGKDIRAYGVIAKTAPVFSGPRGVAVMSKDKFTDDRSRIVAWDSLEKYPFVSIVALSEQDVYAPYETMKRDYVRIAALTSALFALIAVMGILFSVKLALRKRQAAIIKNTYRLATDTAQEGFFMVRAVYDPHRSIIDFVVEDCNQRGAEFLGIPKERAIGVNFSALFPGARAGKVVGIFSAAMDSGFYEDEYCLADNNTRASIWMHRRLVRSGDGLAVTLRDISKAKAQEEILSRMANADALTGLPNRYWLTSYLPKALANAALNQSKAALLYIDLDDFKNINNSMGHAAGDEVLRSAAQRMKSVIRPGDNVVRLGGDEFTVIVEHVDSDDDVARVAARIVAVLSEPFTIKGKCAHAIKASVGISTYPRDGQDMETLLQHADIAMYAAKTNGKGHYQFYRSEFSETIIRKISKEEALRQAVDAGQFVLHYQPRVDAKTGELQSMEALVRWMHPERGLIYPLEFIQLAEESGLILRIGEIVFDKACAQMAEWQRLHARMVPISINVSPKQFSHGSLQSIISRSIERHGIDPRLVEVEITESCMMGDGEKIADDIASIKRLGIKIAVDDFGTGYSSLSLLQKLDVDVLKVDKAFVEELEKGIQGEAFFMTIISMAHILGMRVVAEGVETEEQLRILQALSCNEVQGYLVSKPVPASDAEVLLKRRYLFNHSVGETARKQA